jgi:hypothetical protein
MSKEVARVSNGSKVYEALVALGAIPANCRSLTYTLDVNKVATITYECIATEAIDAAIGSVIDITSLGDTVYGRYAVKEAK